MSLINDALKRAAEADKRHKGGSRRRSGPRGPKGPEALGGPIEPMQPVRRRRAGFLFSPTFGVAMLIVILGCVGAFFIHSWWNSRPRFVLQNLPPGVDPLEAMIVETKPKKSGTEKKLIIVTEDGMKVPIAKKQEEPLTKKSESEATPAKKTAVPPPPKQAVVKPVGIASGPVSKPPTNAPPAAPTILQVTGVEGSKTPDQVAAEKAARLTNSVTLTNASLTNAIAMKGTNGTPAAPVPIMAAKPKKPGIEFPAIKVGGIFIKKDSAIAYVNGKTLAIGDLIEDAELVEISVQYVTFAMKGTEKKYFLAQ